MENWPVFSACNSNNLVDPLPQTMYKPLLHISVKKQPENVFSCNLCIQDTDNVVFYPSVSNSIYVKEFVSLVVSVHSFTLETFSILVVHY